MALIDINRMMALIDINRMMASSSSQVMLLYTMIKWNQAADGTMAEKWADVRQAQHSLVAEQICKYNRNPQ